MKNRGFCFCGRKSKGALPMIVNMSEKATQQEIEHVIERIREAGYPPHITRGTERTIVAAVGSRPPPHTEGLPAPPGVACLVPIPPPVTLVSRPLRPRPTDSKV